MIGKILGKLAGGAAAKAIGDEVGPKAGGNVSASPDSVYNFQLKGPGFNRKMHGKGSNYMPGQQVPAMVEPTDPGYVPDEEEEGMV
jgi:hypothetical protein